MTNKVDLDALQPESAVVTFQGQEITVKPPTTLHVFKLTSLGEKLEKLAELGEDEQADTVTKLQNVIVDVIPELTNHPLGTAQLLALLEMIMQMASPPAAEALKEQGVTPDSPKP